jgi:hypothetical protein
MSRKIKKDKLMVQNVFIAVYGCSEAMLGVWSIVRCIRLVMSASRGASQARLPVPDFWKKSKFKEDNVSNTNKKLKLFLNVASSEFQYRERQLWDNQ